ncbi:hypothetical protein [Chitinasiproducens palmae]|uniref:Uncharacterized protein n=1 Tax=Chitinasiproducens palmae TaxID=1770053 RepID=A0A1H2PRQ8_9BURK|nr:hypothetical protein [Chitinasiproducens palmae]SDV49169.1 hypothetical protein SAMN05216551_107123 [Chitinasiproducens palmae]
MTTFTIQIDDAGELAGITAAREARNAAIDSGDDFGDKFDTDAEYVQFVMQRAAESYARQYGTATD